MPRVTGDGDRLATAQVPVLVHHAEREVASPDDQGGPYEVTIDGVPSRSAYGLDLDDYPELVMDRVDLIGNPLVSELPE